MKINQRTKFGTLIESPCSVSLMRLFFDYGEIEQHI